MTQHNYENGTRGGGTPSPSTREEAPSMMAAGDNIPIGDLIAEREQGRETLEVPERIGGAADVDAVTRARIEMGISPLEIAAERLEEARLSLLEAMKFIDCTDHRDLHLRLGCEVNAQDDLRALLMERCS
jgi:hypothetical protein